MLRTVLSRITTSSSVAPKLLGPAAMAVSARYAGGLAAARSRRFSTQTVSKGKDGKDDTVIAPPFHPEAMAQDHAFDESEWAVDKSKYKKLDTEPFVKDHAFDPSDAYETAVHVMEEASAKTALGENVESSAEQPAFEEPTPEELLEVDLEHNEFVTDHTFDVNDEKLQKNVPKD